MDQVELDILFFFPISSNHRLFRLSECKPSRVNQPVSQSIHGDDSFYGLKLLVAL